MGPCQGGFCTYRAAGILHELAALQPEQVGKSISIENTNAALREFLQERWKGLQPILWGQQLRQERLDEFIYLNILNADHLPGAESTPLAPEMYAPPREFLTDRDSPDTENPHTGEASSSHLNRKPPAVDVVVIGAGYSGLMAAWRCAVLGKKVRLVAKGWGTTHWATGCMDVFGFDERNQLIESPLRAIQELPDRNPKHPYVRIGIERIQTALQTIKDLCSQSGYPLHGDLDKNWLLPTALGTIRPTCLAPKTMLAGDLRNRKPTLIVGFARFPDFYASLIAHNLTLHGIPAKPLTLDLPELRQHRFLNGRVLAALFEQQGFRQSLVDVLKPSIGVAERIGFPSVFGLNSSISVHQDLEERLGCAVFEIPTLPPSIPGIRLHNILTNAIEDQGGRVYESMQVVGAQSSMDAVQLIWSEAAARQKAHSARVFVLATGGILGGGFITDFDGAIREGIFGLPVTGTTGSRESWFKNAFLAPGGHPIYQAGLEINDQLHPLDLEGNVIYQNVFATGSTLAHHDSIQERSLEGIALSNAFLLAEQISGL